MISSAVDLLGTLLKESKSKNRAAVVPDELCPRSPLSDVSESGNELIISKTIFLKKTTNIFNYQQLTTSPVSDPVCKLTGWIQWTFTKCLLNIYYENETEMTKLLVETEDSIISLEFDDVFHKFKIKLTSFGVYHRVK